MAKPAGTPDGVGLVHMPLLAPLYAVTYEQVGGFGPVNRPEAFAAIKMAGNIGRSRPDVVWVQKGSSAADSNLANAITKAKTQFRIAATIEKDGAKANEGWGVYYQYGRFVIVEHTSDPNSVVTTAHGSRQLPHFHIEEAPLGMVAATGSGHTFDVKRVERLGSASPLTPLAAKLNHHVYYVPMT